MTDTKENAFGPPIVCAAWTHPCHRANRWMTIPLGEVCDRCGAFASAPMDDAKPAATSAPDAAGCAELLKTIQELHGEANVLVKLLLACGAVIATIEPENDDEADRLAYLRTAIDAAMAEHGQSQLGSTSIFPTTPPSPDQQVRDGMSRPDGQDGRNG